jgi:hypothetical protein
VQKLCALAFFQVKTTRLLQNCHNSGLIELSVRLNPGPLNGRTFASVQNTVLDRRCIGRTAHNTI